MSEPCPTACLDRVPDAFPLRWSRADALAWLSALNAESAEERVLLYLVYGGRVFNLQGSLPGWWSTEQLLQDLLVVLSGPVAYIRTPAAGRIPKLVRRIVCLCERCDLSVSAVASALPWRSMEHHERLYFQYAPEMQVNRTVSELKRKLSKLS